MTVVVTIINKEENKAYLGSDRLVSFNQYGHQTDEKFFEKTIEFNDTKQKIILGLSGTIKLRPVLSSIVEWDNFREKFDDFEHYFAKYIAPQIKAQFDEEEDLVYFFVIHDQEIYLVDTGLTIIRIVKNWFAIGEGMEYALGSLHSTSTMNKDYTMERIKEAITVANEYCLHCEGIATKEYKI
jgi:ATP-dependent protease HslVU (ClpYQ) peptidase subunit